MRYLVRADDNAATLGVGEGKVTVTRTSDGRTITVRGGQNLAARDDAEFQAAEGCFCMALKQNVDEEIRKLNE